MNSFPELVSNGRDIALFMDNGGFLFEEIGNLNFSYIARQETFPVAMFGSPYTEYIKGLKSYEAYISFVTKEPKSISEEKMTNLFPKTFSELTILEVFELIDKKLDIREGRKKIKTFSFPFFLSNRERLILITDENYYINMNSPIMIHYNLSVTYMGILEVRMDFRNNGECYIGLLDDLDVVMDITLQSKSINDLLSIIDSKLRKREEKEEEKLCLGGFLAKN